MSTADLAPSDTVERSPRLAQRLFEGRMLVITVDDSKLHRFNEVGTFIWQQLNRPNTIAALGDAVAANFDGCDRETALGDVTAFVRSLLDKRLASVKAAG